MPDVGFQKTYSICPRQDRHLEQFLLQRSPWVQAELDSRWDHFLASFLSLPHLDSLTHFFFFFFWKPHLKIYVPGSCVRSYLSKSKPKSGYTSINHMKFRFIFHKRMNQGGQGTMLKCVLVLTWLWQSSRY